MAGAISLAEMLRDEYVYFFGEQPPLEIKVYERHLRDLPDLIRRLKQPDQTARNSILAPYCDFTKADTPAKERDTVCRAFQALIDSETVRKLPENPSLYEALLQRVDDDTRARLRSVETLRKLLSIPGARQSVFRDATAAGQVANSQDLQAVFKESSAAVRLVDAMPRGKTLFKAHPALLATIADDPGLEDFLTNSTKNRKALIDEFLGDTEESLWSRFPSLLRPKKKAETPTLDDLRKKFHIPEKKREAPHFRLFNALALEVAFDDCFTDSYATRALHTAFHKRDMAALCLSGGGIRSATFNLGVLQGLADHGLLTKFHYLSTVSGGGYIGSWLSSWIRRHPDGLAGVAHDIKSPPADPEDPEVLPIRHLREYSSYLAPRPMSLSVDTWTLIATYLRNLLLNWTILLPTIAAILALPRLMASAIHAAVRNGNPVTWGATSLTATAMAFGLIVGMRPKKDRTSGPEPTDADIRKEKRFTIFWIVPFFVAAVTFCVFWASLAPTRRATDTQLIKAIPPILMVISALAALRFVLAQSFARAPEASWWKRMGTALKLLVNPRSRFKILRHAAGEVICAGGAGYAGGLFLSVAFARAFPPETLLRSNETLFFEQFICFGIPLFLFSFFIEGTFLVGLTTPRATEQDREWWARCAAITLLCAFLVMLVALITIVGPLILASLPVLLASAGGASAVASWLIARSAKLASKDERGKTSRIALTFVLHVVTAIAIAVVLAALALTTSVILSIWTQHRVPFPPGVFRFELTPVASLHLRVLHQASWQLIATFIGSAIAGAWSLSFFLDVNIYSMHAMYRSRLIRAFLGASRWQRRPDPFTGFDPQDDIAMFELRPEALWTSSYPNFREFATTLEANKHIFPQLHLTVQTLVKAYCQNDEKNRPDELEVCSAVTRELNKLMASRDLRNDHEASPTYALSERIASISKDCSVRSSGPS